MALSSEDKKDVKGAMGKALANKVAKVTRDKNYINRPRTKRMEELGIERADVINARMALKYPKSAEDKAKVTRDSNLEKRYKIHQGRTAKKYENEANPEMHSFKNSMRRKGFSDAKIFSGALRQGERYNAKSKALSKKSDRPKDYWKKGVQSYD